MGNGIIALFATTTKHPIRSQQWHICWAHFISMALDGGRMMAILLPDYISVRSAVSLIFLMHERINHNLCGWKNRLWRHVSRVCELESARSDRRFSTVRFFWAIDMQQSSRWIQRCSLVKWHIQTSGHGALLFMAWKNMANNNIVLNSGLNRKTRATRLCSELISFNERNKKRHKCGWASLRDKWSALRSVADLDGPGPESIMQTGMRLARIFFVCVSRGKCNTKEWRNSYRARESKTITIHYRMIHMRRTWKSLPESCGLITFFGNFGGIW